jgi:micrococcal nuclease
MKYLQGLRQQGLGVRVPAGLGWLFALFIFLGPVTVHARAAALADWYGTVTAVVDGDTVRVRPLAGGKPVSVRIDGIDAPEICQTGGKASRLALRARVMNQQVHVLAVAHDDYGRVVARLEIGQQDVGRWLVSQGHAWSYRHRSSAGPYAAEQSHAQGAGLGLFAPGAGGPLVYPGDFRRNNGSCFARHKRE